jgi:hypothetical protein
MIKLQTLLTIILKSFLGIFCRRKKQHLGKNAYQNRFRNPSTQDQYIGFNVGCRFLWVLVITNKIYEHFLATAAGGQWWTNKEVMTGENAYNNSYTRSCFAAFAGTGNATLLKNRCTIGKMERSEKTFELGYRSQIEDINIDITDAIIFTITL